MPADSEANGASANGPVISADGRYVGFESQATNLVTGDGTSGVLGQDVFVRAVVTPTVESDTPSEVARGDSATLTVTGSGFLNGTRVTANVFTTDGVVVNSVVVNSETEIEVAVSVNLDAPTGERNLIVLDSRHRTRPLSDGLRLLLRLSHRHLTAATGVNVQQRSRADHED